MYMCIDIQTSSLISISIDIDYLHIHSDEYKTSKPT